MSKVRLDDIENIKRAIPDERIRQLCFCREFNDDDFLKSKPSIYKYFNGIMQTAFFFVYGRYKQWEETSERAAQYKRPLGTKNFNRIVSILEGLYEKHPLSHDYISEVLTDIQIDIAFSRQDNHEYDLNIYQSLNDLYLKHDIERDNHKYAEYDYLAKLYVGRHSFDDAIIDVDASSTLQDRRDDIIQLVSLTFRFLSFLHAKDLKIEKLQQCVRVDDHFEYPYVEDLKEIAFEYRGLMPTEDRKQFQLPNDISTKFSLISSIYTDYYLRDLNNPIDSNGNRYLIFNYISYENFEQENMKKRIFVFESNTPDSDIPEGEYFIRDSEILTLLKLYFFKGGQRSKKQRKKVLDDYSTINYKYIRVLSLAIADIIEEPLVDRLIKDYFKMYPVLFNDEDDNKKLDENEIANIDWESLIAVLLIEESSINVLKRILFWNFKSSKRINIELTYNLQTRLGIDNFNAKHIIEESEQEASELMKNWAANSRIDSISNEFKNNFLDEESYVRAIVYSNHIVAALAHAFGEQDTVNKICSLPASIRTRKMWLHVIKKIEDKKKRHEALKSLTLQTIIHLVSFYEGFIKYVQTKKKFYMYKNKDEAKQAQHLVNEAFYSKYRSIFKELSEHDKDGQYIFNSVKKLNDECKTGPSYVFEKHDFVKSFLGRTSLFKIELFEPISMIDCIDPEDNETMNKMFDAVLKLFEYLSPDVDDNDQTNETKNNRKLAIYPYIATYIFQQKTKDGYMVKQFDVSDYGADFTIRVLTEFDCEQNHLYYCLPNTLRYNEEINIWIEPILIDSEIFNKGNI